MSLSRGGYAYGYEITTADGVHIGNKSVWLEKRGDKAVITYTLLDGRQFSNPAEFVEAYNKKVEDDRRDKEWEAAKP